jgi:Zn-dependent oligopeptidase
MGGVDEEAVKEYFPVSKVVPAILEIYRQLLNVRFYPVPRTAEAGGMTWHEGQSSILFLYRDDSDQVSRC